MLVVFMVVVWWPVFLINFFFIFLKKLCLWWWLVALFMLLVVGGSQHALGGWWLSSCSWWPADVMLEYGWAQPVVWMVWRKQNVLQMDEISFWRFCSLGRGGVLRGKPWEGRGVFIDFRYFIALCVFIDFIFGILFNVNSSHLN
uniref:Uncharacterized protein n=1 Tax=Meloidogyne enterolobii TaxID=390850 RepID=A0A6V7TRE8_MELEN|nr:unnamed protein product [Meloidogyne enterolobii]